jgi:hypothetical protein
MNVDKATKRIAKRVKNGADTTISDVEMSFVIEENASAQHEKFSCNGDARQDETLQTTLLKVIERTGAKTVVEHNGM